MLYVKKRIEGENHKDVLKYLLKMKNNNEIKKLWNEIYKNKNLII